MTTRQTNFNEEEKIWSAAHTPTIFNPKNSLGYVILWSMERNASKIIQISHDTNIQLTNEFMRMKVIRAATNLQKMGCEPGDIICIIAKNSHFVAPIVLASICIACPVNCLDPLFSKTEIVHMLSITAAKVVFCDVDVYDLVRECLTELENDASVFTFSGKTDESTSVEEIFEETPEEKGFSVVDVDGENTTVAIVCTSGSTGLPKGVCLSHAAIMNQVASLGYNANDLVLGFSSLYWISGLLMLLSSFVQGFCRLITTESFSPDLMLDMIEEHQVTCVAGASHAIVLTLKSEKLSQANLSSIRGFICAGSKLLPSTALDFSKYLTNGGIIQIYGLSEMAGASSCGIVTPESNGSVGRLLMNTQAKIIDDDGNRLGANEHGEIYLKPGYAFLGYLNNEEATLNAMDEDGFFKTGDIGYFDENCNLYLVDRNKEMIKYCSSQVSPSEIENYLVQHAGIKAVCVVGIPDPTVGDLPAALIIRQEGDDGASISRDEVEQMVTEYFADYKRLRGGVYFVDEFPLTPSGKVMRRKVKEIAIEMYENENGEAE